MGGVVSHNKFLPCNAVCFSNVIQDASFPVVEDDNAPSIDEEPVERVPKKKRIVRKKEKKEVTNSKKPSKRKRMIEDDIEVEEGT